LKTPLEMKENLIKRTPSVSKGSVSELKENPFLRRRERDFVFVFYVSAMP